MRRNAGNDVSSLGALRQDEDEDVIRFGDYLASSEDDLEPFSSESSTQADEPNHASASADILAAGTTALGSPSSIIRASEDTTARAASLASMLPAPGEPVSGHLSPVMHDPPVPFDDDWYIDQPDAEAVAEQPCKGSSSSLDIKTAGADRVEQPVEEPVGECAAPVTHAEFVQGMSPGKQKQFDDLCDYLTALTLHTN
jgi:hypothetical protein